MAQTPEQLAIAYIHEYLEMLFNEFHGDRWDSIEYLLQELEHSSDFTRGREAGCIDTYDELCGKIRRKQEHIVLPALNLDGDL